MKTSNHWAPHLRALCLGLGGVLLAACGNSGLAVGPGLPGGTPGVDALTVKVLSNRADLISGNDALVEVALPPGLDASTIRMVLDGRDISSAFALRENGRYMGLVTGMSLGANRLQALLPNGSGSEITIQNHPVGGPVFSGPQIMPWTCAVGALDAQCNRNAVVSYQYKSRLAPPGGSAAGANVSSFRPYDPENPPNDVATITTDNGTTVPYIVRVETGAIDRDEYRIAVVYDPSQPWEPWAPQPQFNHKLLITHGASCDTAYEQGSASNVMNDSALSRGFAVMSNALNNSGHNCQVAVQAESMVMTKERVVESLGELRYTIGTGCSGGALAQQWMANAYPGLYQAISPACSFTDAWSSAQQYVDYVLLRGYFEDPSRWAPGVVWAPTGIEAVYGHPNPVNPITFTEVIPNSGNPTRSCPGVAAEDVYDAESNPGGVRCTLQDYTVNIFGRRTPDRWTPQEKQIGRGFANRPFDNVGIQYGLAGLMAGTLSAAQFVDVNAKAGSLDYHGFFDTARSEADPGSITNAFRSGSANVGNNLDQLPIIDLRGPDPGAFHDAYRAYAMRARLDREHGHHDNQLIWRGPVALFGDVTFADAAVLALDSWLTNIEADLRPLPLADKVLANKPAALVERCTNGAGTDVPAASCDAIVQAYSSPRIEAGMPLTDDVLKCQLKPLARADYPVSFTDAQWATLQATFPTGVCDYSKPADGFAKTVPWLDYSAGPGGVPLGAPPVATAIR